MKILLSEAPPDYGNYVFPYVVWGFLEPHETPADALNHGFLPSLPDLSRFYLCRQVRVDLSCFSLSSENRRILRKGTGIQCTILDRSAFEWTPQRRDFCHGYATKRWSSPPTEGRIDRIFHSAMTTQVALFQDPQGNDIGIVSLYRDKATWFYSNAFYEPDAPSGRGAFLMTEIVHRLCEDRQAFLHLGTCYSRSSLYKTQFQGMQFFDGTRWQGDVRALKHILGRVESGRQGHLLEDEEYRERWFPEETASLESESRLTLHSLS
jgi:hypothetical protein